MAKQLKYILSFCLAVLIITACTPSNETKVPKIGEAVPNISWTTITGEKIDLKQFKNSWVLLCFWCTCCGHSVDIQVIHDIYDALYEKNLKVVVIDDGSIYSPEITLEGFGKENKLPFYLVQDKQVTINKIMIPKNEPISRPIYFLVDPDGNLRDIKQGTFYADVQPPTRLPINEWEMMDRGKYQLNEYQLKTIDVLAFLYDAIAVKFNDVAVTNVTSNGATISWKTDKAVPCWLDFKAPAGYCTNKTARSTKYQWMIDDFIPDYTYVFTITACGFDRSKLKLPMNMNSSSNEYSFTTIKGEYDKEYSGLDTHKYKSIFTAPIISEAMISNITDTSAEIKWKTDQEATSIANISYSDDTGQEVSMIKEDYNLTKNHTFKLENLVPRKLYSVDLRAEDALGRFEKLDMYSFGFVTQPRYYSYRTHIYNFEIADITDSSAKLSWSTGNPTFCTICTPDYCFVEEARVKTKDTKHAWVLSDLAPGKEYWVQIQTSEAVSDVFNFKTMKATDNVDIK